VFQLARLVRWTFALKHSQQKMAAAAEQAEILKIRDATALLGSNIISTKCI